MSKLWGGRFAKETDRLTDEFNASISFDKRLYREDIEGSIAHARMLRDSAGVLTDGEARLIIEGLEGILCDIEAGKVEFREDLEDVHMNIEQLLTDRIGEAGKKLHTGRSRNDQVATDMMLFVRRACGEVQGEIARLIETLVSAAEANGAAYLPGYTHLQRAQPITYAHYLGAYCEMLRRDYTRFRNIVIYGLSDSPLGSGALAGTTYPIDRAETARLLGFDGVKANTLDGVSDRDYAIDFLEACAVCMMHLSRFCEELILHSSSEFGFITLDDAYTTGSSIMPQKKNPDLAELIRGKTGRVYGNLMSMLTTMKGLPLAYNKDMQEDKEPVFDSFDTVVRSLHILANMVGTMRVNREAMEEAAKGGFTNATDMADWLVRHGVAFRDAHAIVGSLVLKAESEGKGLEDLTLAELREASPAFDESVYGAISLEAMVESRAVPGGPSSAAVSEELEGIREWLRTLE